MRHPHRQFGLQPDKARQKKWEARKIKDDPNTGVTLGNGYVQFAGGGHNSRSCHMYVHRRNNLTLGGKTRGLMS